MKGFRVFGQERQGIDHLHAGQGASKLIEAAGCH